MREGAKVQDYGIDVSLNSSCAILFTFGLITWERYEPPYPYSCRLNSITIVLLQG